MDVHWCYDKNNVVPEALRLINQAQWIAPHAFDFSRGLVDFVHLYEYLITKYSTFTAIFNCSGALSENKYLSVPFHVITRFYWSSATFNTYDSVEHGTRRRTYACAFKNYYAREDSSSSVLDSSCFTSSSLDTETSYATLVTFSVSLTFLTYSLD